MRILSFVLFFGFLFAQASAQADKNTWPTAHGDNQRSGYTDVVLNTKNLERKWFKVLVEELMNPYSEPIVAEGLVFVGTYKGNLYALSLKDGSVAWKIETKSNGIGNSPCYANGKIFFATDDSFDKGTLYCVDAKSGNVAWTYNSKAGFWNSPMVEGDSVYIGDRGGVFHGVNAKSGKGIFTVECPNMILTPASATEDGKTIVFGCEDMKLRAVNPQGKLLWESEKVEGATMRHYAPTIWGDKAVIRTNPATSFHHSLESGSAKEAHMQVTKDNMEPSVLKRYNEVVEELAELRKDAWKLKGDERKERNNQIKALDKEKDQILKTVNEEHGDKIWWDDWGQFKMRWTEERYKLDIKLAEERLKKDPGQRTFHVVLLKDGSEPWQAPVLYMNGKHGVGGPAVINKKTGELYVWGSGTVTNFSSGVPGNTAALLRIDPKTGMPEFINHKDRGHDNPGSFGGSPFSQPADESQSLSFMGPDLLVNSHMGTIHAFNINTRKIVPMVGQRDTYALIFGPFYQNGQGGSLPYHWDGGITILPNQWHGPGRGIVAIVDKIFVWIDGSSVAVFGESDVEGVEGQAGNGQPANPPKRSETPVWPGGNWPNPPTDPFDESVKKPEVSVAQAAKIIDNAPKAKLLHGNSALAKKTRKLLSEEVNELIDGHPWRPFYWQTGFTGTDPRFHFTSQNMKILAEALPHLEEKDREKLLDFLDERFEEGWGHKQYILDKMEEGKSREFFTTSEHEIHTRIKDFDRGKWKIKFDAEQLSGLGAYAVYGERMNKVTELADKLSKAYNETQKLKFKVGDVKVGSRGAKQRYNEGEDLLNQRINGAIAYARIMDAVGKKSEREKAEKDLAAHLAERLWLTMADKMYIVSNAHRGKISRFEHTSPELLDFLANKAKDKYTYAVTELIDQGPSWHLALGDLLMGGENWTHPPEISHGLFIAWADGLHPDAEELWKVVDRPWCEADLYYIERLSALLRQMDK